MKLVSKMIDHPIFFFLFCFAESKFIQQFKEASPVIMKFEDEFT